jgi:hypothetical protein
MGKNIIIKENHLDILVNKLLTEKMGVPEGIIDSAKLVYKQVLQSLKNMPSNKRVLNPKQGEESQDEFNLKGNYRISDANFNKLSFIFEFGEISDEQIDLAPALMSMAYRQENSRDFENYTFLTVDTNGKLKFSAQLAVSKYTTYSEIYELFLDSENQMISSMAHELKHTYDFLKKDTTRMTSLAKYQAPTSMRFRIKTIDDFFFNLYFLHDIESLVRNTEIATYMDLEGVDKENFESFLKNQKIYQTLDSIRKFTYRGFKTDLLNDIEHVRDIFEQNGIDLPSDDNEAIDMVIDLVYKNLVDRQGASYARLLASSLFEKMIGLSGDKQMEVDRFVKQLSRFKDGEEFFRYIEKDFQQTGDKVLKKIIKLYDMAKDTEKTKSTDLMRKITSKGETTESIIDWDLHQQLMEKKHGRMKIKTKFDF